MLDLLFAVCFLKILHLKLIHELENKRNVKVNVTAMMSAQQCFLAAKAGASYVSIFGGRVNNMGYDSNKEISILRNLLDKFNLNHIMVNAQFS